MVPIGTLNTKGIVSNSVILHFLVFFLLDVGTTLTSVHVIFEPRAPKTRVLARFSTPNVSNLHRT